MIRIITRPNALSSRQAGYIQRPSKYLPSLGFFESISTNENPSFPSSSSFVAPLFQNQSCDPFTPISKPCTLGNYVDFAINVTSAADVIAGVRFAQSQNIRLVIKNTGHDLLGKSTGKGALGIWTHYLKSTRFSTYRSATYSGPAAKLGAGIQGWEAYEAANANGLRVVGGTCPTVGVSGGYTQGGGHSLLSSINGLSADNVLEWEVVTADGNELVATPSNSPDLYWALSGGGGGTYAIVISMTVKAHAEGLVSTAALSIASTDAGQDEYWSAIAAFHANLPVWVDEGAVAPYTITDSLFYLQPLTFPGLDAQEVTTLIQPFIVKLKTLNVTYALNITAFPTYFEAFAQYFGPLPYGTYTSAQVQGGRLMPRSVVENNNAGLTAALKKITASGPYTVIGVGVNVSHAVAGNTPSTNAVLPNWRDSLITFNIFSEWDFSIPLAQNVAKETEITQTIVPTLEAISPGAGAYLNEADPNQPNWQETFYGSNYAALKAVKKKYDPLNLFYATTAVGSEAWVVASDGRLCRSGD